MYFILSLSFKASPCAALTSPSAGSISPASCTTGQSKTGTACTVTCNQGYKFMGNAALTCNSNGQWSNGGMAVTCKGLLFVFYCMINPFPHIDASAADGFLKT